MKTCYSVMIWYCKYIMSSSYVNGRIACSRFVWGYLPCVFNCLVLALLVTCDNRPGLLWAWLLHCQHSWACCLSWWEILLPGNFPFDNIWPGFLRILQRGPSICGHSLDEVWKSWSCLVCAQVPFAVRGAELVMWTGLWGHRAAAGLGCAVPGAHPAPPRLVVQGSSATARLTALTEIYPTVHGNEFP